MRVYREGNINTLNVLHPPFIPILSRRHVRCKTCQTLMSEVCVPSPGLSYCINTASCVSDVIPHLERRLRALHSEPSECVKIKECEFLPPNIPD